MRYVFSAINSEEFVVFLREIAVCIDSKKISPTHLSCDVRQSASDEVVTRGKVTVEIEYIALANKASSEPEHAEQPEDAV